MSTVMHTHNTHIHTHVDKTIYLQRHVCIQMCVYDYWLNILSYLLHISVVLRDEQKAK